jgi:hypothetical protein
VKINREDTRRDAKKKGEKGTGKKIQKISFVFLRDFYRIVNAFVAKKQKDSVTSVLSVAILK